jgi:HAD superfamily hydrolase (TIGR01509 family)
MEWNHMEPINFVIFDMDGLLFDTERMTYLAMKKTFAEQGFEFNLANYKKTIGLTRKEVNITLQNMLGNNLDPEHFFDERSKHFNKILKDEGLILKPGAKKLLTVLEQKDIKCCIASSSSRETIAKYLKLTGLESFFNFYISGNEVQRGKPAPDIFLEACSRANEPLSKSIVLEDSLNGLKAAHESNIRCIIVPDMITPDNEMKEKSFSIISNLEEVIPLLE